MAEEFQTGVCSSWWNVARSNGFDGSAASVSASASSVSCSSTGIDDMVNYCWMSTEISPSKARSCEDSSVSCSSLTFQDVHKVAASVPMVTGGLLIDPSMPVTGFGLSSPSIDWNQALLRSGGGRGDQSSFPTMLQEEMSSSKPYFHQEAATMNSNHQVQMAVVEDMNQTFMIDQHHLGSCNESANPSMFLQGLFEPDLKPQPSVFDNTSNYHLSSEEMKYPQFFKSSPPTMTLKQQQVGQLHFSNNTTYWNAPATSVINEPRPGFFPPVHTQFFPRGFDAKSNATSVTSKPNSDGARDSSTAGKKGGNEPALKKPRVETPSPLPTFKVRKEKLSDRITALQQLVSPFGKTDTASVLYEAIEYIKFLHDQVNVLSTPYLKNGNHLQHQQQNFDKSTDGDGPKPDLRSRGLCLVPISSTFPVANEPTSDFWTPTFGGSYR